MSKKLEIINTADGSKSLYNQDLKQSYHSFHGAVSESVHVYIQNGLHFFKDKIESLSILEIGLGTGLNVLLTLNDNSLSGKTVDYTALEPFPLPLDIINELDLSQFAGNSSEQQKMIHTCSFNEEIFLGTNFKFKKLNTKIQNTAFNKTFDLIYYDAFAPSAQPELWTPAAFKKVYSILNKNGIVVTYCAKGQIKRNMKACGFKVESLPGPPRKREMTRGIKLLDHDTYHLVYDNNKNINLLL